MAASTGHDSRQYSWLWVSHISPKNSKWLQENLSDMDMKVKAMIKLINEDADSFARRAEMYYKKRPELMKQVEEFYRAYRALAERYDQATGALRQAHRTISEVFPNQMPSMDESPSSSGQEVEPHTPDMSTLSRTPFESNDHTSKRNGSHPQETSALSNRKSLKQSSDFSLSGESATHAVFDGKAQKELSFESPEVKGRDDSNGMGNMQKEISRLLAENENLKQQMLSESERAKKSESEMQIQKDAVFQLNSEKDTSLLQYDQSTERLSTLESELSKAQTDLKKLTDEMALQVQKVNSAESRNSVIQSEFEALDQMAKIQQQELEQKLKELENLHFSFQEEHEKRMHAESVLLSEGKERAQCQEEVQRLTTEIKMANEKLDELMQSKMDLESTACELKKEVESLTEQNHSSKLLMQELHDEISSLRDSKSELQNEIQSLRGVISQLNTEKDGALLQHQNTIILLNSEKDAALLENQDSSMRVSNLESELLKLEAELNKVEERVEVLEQELKHKQEELYNLQTSLENKTQQCIEGEAALLSVTGLHSESRDEVNKLTMDIEKLSGKLSEVESNKMDLENIVNQYTEDIHILREQNLSAELTIKGLHCELDALKELNVKLEAEMGSHIGEKEAIQRDFVHQREEKENLEGTHHALAVEMDALKGSAAANQKLIEDLQITNLKLKEVCAKNLIENALLSEKVQEIEKLSEEYSLLENSISDANAEMEGLREKIKALESSESSLKGEVSSCVSEKAVIVAELGALGKSFADISEKNSVLEMSLSDIKAELENLRVKLKDSEETCQAQLADNLALSAEKNNLVSQLENIKVVTKALEGKHADLKDEHISLSRENDLVYDQVRKLKGLLRTINKEYEDTVKSHEMHASSLEEQISYLQGKLHDMDEMLEEQEQKNMRTSISVVVLEGSLVDLKDKNGALLEKCQKYAVEHHAAEILISQLEDQARFHEEESKTLLKHNRKLREGISQHMKVLNINRDVGHAEIAHDEILLQTVSDETSNVVKLKEEIEDVNTLMYTELSVLATVMLQVGMEFRDLHLQKCALEKEVENEATEIIFLQKENCRLLECNEQLRQKNSERDHVQKTEALVLYEKLSCLTESYQTLKDENTDMTEKNESLSKENQSLIEKYKAMEDEISTVLAECMMLGHLCLFLRGHNNEVASALVSLTDEMAFLSLAKGESDSEVKVLSARAIVLESENDNLKKYLGYLIEVLRTRLVLLELELNTGESVCQELAIELESCMAQLLQKDDELLEAEENFQLMQQKNRELCGVVGALQVAIEGAKVVKGELEKKIVTLTEEGTAKDDEIFLLRQANETLQVDACILKKKEQSLSSAHELMSKEFEQHERESALLVGDAITSSVNAAVYEEKALKFMMEAKAIEISTIAQMELILNKMSSQDSHIEALQKKVYDMEEENSEIRTKWVEAKEIYSENEKQKDSEGSKGKQVQMMKDIELDQISSCPPYGAGIYPVGNVANAELDDEMLQLWEAAEKTCKNQTAKSSSSEHDIQTVEEVKSEYPSSELIRGRDLRTNKPEMSSAFLVEPHEVWGKNVVERLTSDAQRLLSIQESIEEVKRKMGGPSKGRSPMNSEYDGITTQLDETEGFVLEQINLNSTLTKKAENYPALSDSMNAEREGLPSRRKISEQVQKGSDNVARLELEIQKIQYVLLKLEEEQEYRRLKVSDKRTRVLLKDYLYGRTDHRGVARKKKAPFCGCVPSKSRTEP
ncbi:unnamed protein product [Alopecurus aequalis]